jgi:alpha-1,2-mannosyltransferase
MWNEHFGIGIVEMMAAGLIVIAHNSGGPKSDIIIPFEGKQTGYLATTPEEYAAAVYKVMTLPMGEQAERRRSAQASSARFSDDLFAESFRKVVIDSNLLTS